LRLNLSDFTIYFTNVDINSNFIGLHLEIFLFCELQLYIFFIKIDPSILFDRGIDIL